MTEGHRCICETEWHDEPLVGTIARAEGSLPLVACCNANQVVSMPEVESGIDSGTARCMSGTALKAVRSQWKWVAIFLGDLVQPSEVNAKSEGSILFADEEDQCRMSGSSGTNEPGG
ncbi:uncharacterized protein EI90DRAFT_2924823 [Cantharellus anzutake]|uniref:uncharacterized protein n=1 Tax=Cantharellus anzutake TaxID=1750568 RepID=UPI0019084901|nr:uncharacterized protein EI90DRAFT_2924823 [Cantharellus anzutake]KAF8328928.1 hypothetical protein EI90DRAFT_2924823 [Cantharellus anzutake]